MDLENNADNDNSNKEDNELQLGELGELSKLPNDDEKEKQRKLRIERLKAISKRQSTNLPPNPIQKAQSDSQALPPFIPGSNSKETTDSNQIKRLKSNGSENKEYHYELLSNLESKIPKYFDESHILKYNTKFVIDNDKQNKDVDIDIKFKVYSTYPRNYDSIHLIDPESKKPFQPLIYFLHHGGGETCFSFALLIRKLRNIFDKYNSNSNNDKEIVDDNTYDEDELEFDENEKNQQNEDNEDNYYIPNFNNMKDILPPCYIVTFDCRAHGLTEMYDNTKQEILKNQESTLMIDNLCNDFMYIVENEVDRIINHYKTKFFSKLMSEQPDIKDFILKPNIVLIGHSMGGSVIIKSCNPIIKSFLNSKKQFNIVGVIPIDVVEGTAIESLPNMKHFLEITRPKYFSNLNEAIDWSLKSNTLNTKLGASTSIPAQVYPILLLNQKDYLNLSDDLKNRLTLYNDDDKLEVINYIKSFNGNIMKPKGLIHKDKLLPKSFILPTNLGNLKETDNDNELLYVGNPGDDIKGANIIYKWKTNLFKTEIFWENWFKDISKEFLKSMGNRMLILAGTDRLDTELLIGQMQGKYQLIIFKESGHGIMEDEPLKLSKHLIEFYIRNKPLVIIKRFAIPPLNK